MNEYQYFKRNRNKKLSINEAFIAVKPWRKVNERSETESVKKAYEPLNDSVFCDQTENSLKQFDASTLIQH